MEEDHIVKHSTTQSLILHLLPGILVGCFYFLARQPVANMGYPSIFALLLAFAFILIPVEFGYLLYQVALHYRGSSAIENQSRGGRI